MRLAGCSARIALGKRDCFTWLDGGVLSRRATPGMSRGGPWPHPANRYGGSWVGLTL